MRAKFKLTENHPFLKMSMPHVEMKVLETPISDRYCNVGDIILLDVRLNKLRCKGVWFDFDKGWRCEPIYDKETKK